MKPRGIAIIVGIALLSTGAFICAYKWRASRDKRHAKVAGTLQLGEHTLEVREVPHETQRHKWTTYLLVVKDAAGKQIAERELEDKQPACSRSGSGKLSCTWGGTSHALDPATLMDKP